jgi:hypothetical protein
MVPTKVKKAKTVPNEIHNLVRFRHVDVIWLRLIRRIGASLVSLVRSRFIPFGEAQQISQFEQIDLAHNPIIKGLVECQEKLKSLLQRPFTHPRRIGTSLPEPVSRCVKENFLFFCVEILNIFSQIIKAAKPGTLSVEEPRAFGQKFACCTEHACMV